MSTLFTKADPLAEELAGIKARINAEAADNYQNKEWRMEVAQEITEGIYQGYNTNNFIDLMTETLQLPLDGRFVIEEVRGLEAFWHGRGGYIEESDLWKDSFEIGADTIGFHLVQSEDRLRTGFAETAETLVRLGRQRLTAELNKRVLSTYQAAVQSGDDSFVGVSGLSLANLNSALSGVRDASESDEVVIVGRHTMTDKIVDALTGNNTYALFTPETNEQLLRTGVQGSYRRARIITLPNVVDAYSTSQFPANELWIIGRDAGKAAYFGESQFKEFIEDDNWNWHYIYRQDFASTLIYKNRVRRIVDSTVAV